MLSQKTGICKPQLALWEDTNYIHSRMLVIGQNIISDIVGVAPNTNPSIISRFLGHSVVLDKNDFNRTEAIRLVHFS